MSNQLKIPIEYEIEPKPCPFCGKNVATVASCIENEDCANFEQCGENGYYTVVCNFNDGGCGAAGGYAKTKEKAIKVWNRRADNEQTD